MISLSAFEIWQGLESGGFMDAIQYLKSIDKIKRKQIRADQLKENKIEIKKQDGVVKIETKYGDISRFPDLVNGGFLWIPMVTWDFYSMERLESKTALGAYLLAREPAKKMIEKNKRIMETGEFRIIRDENGVRVE